MTWLKLIFDGNHHHPQQPWNRRWSASNKSIIPCFTRFPVVGTFVFSFLSLYLLGLCILVAFVGRQDTLVFKHINNTFTGYYDPPVPQQLDPNQQKVSTSLDANSNHRSQIDRPAAVITKLETHKQWCHFEGHCPVGTTCVGHAASPSGGVCQEYRPSTRLELIQPQQQASGSESNEVDQKLFNDCISKCRTELQWDEHYYYDIFVPKFKNTLKATPFPTSSAQQQRQRPPACVLVFERMRGKNKELEKTSADDWIDERKAQHIIRVDPLIEDTTANLTASPTGILWTALCYYPCQTDADCGRGGSVDGAFFLCDKSRGVCDRNPDYWLPSKAPNSSRTVFVTGADAGYWNGLINFAASARFWAPQNPLVVYNLGLTKEQLAVVESWSNVIAIEWREGIPYQPPHVHDLKVYAWKPLAINESVHKYQNIFWHDAGATFAGPIDQLEHYLQRTGIFLAKGQDETMYPMAHENTFRYFHVDKEAYLKNPHYGGSVQGHLFPSRYVNSIVKVNAACALDAACINPEGAVLENHRYDQTTLSIIAYGRYHMIPHHTEFVAADVEQLNPDLTQPNVRFLWTSRQTCSFYFDREVKLLGNPQQDGTFHNDSEYALGLEGGEPVLPAL